MSNPFEILDKRLSTIEDLLLEVKHGPRLPAAPAIIEQQPEIEFDIKGLSKYYGWSIQTINNYKDAGLLPFYRLGRKIWFKKSEIEDLARVPMVGEKKGKV